jgi:ADP-heptose:LPS heptosyltransferase
VRRPLPDLSFLTGDPGYVVVHPSASVPARQPSPARSAELVEALAAAGYRVIVTGAAGEPTAQVAGTAARDLGGATDLPGLASVLEHAAVVIAPNTGPAHLAAAVGTPVISLFAPVVPAARWAPYGVPHALLGDQHAPCRDTRARECPVPGHPCLDALAPGPVLAAVAELVATPGGTS